MVAPAGYGQDDMILRVEDSYDENNMAEKTGEAIHVLDIVIYKNSSFSQSSLYIIYIYIYICIYIYITYGPPYMCTCIRTRRPRQGHCKCTCPTII